MFRSGIGIAVLASLIGVTGCATRAETVGAATGVAAGAALGGGALETIGGGMVGYAAGRSYEEHHAK